LIMYVFDLGELQSDFLQLKEWTDKQYDIEKAKTIIAKVKEGQTATYANNVKNAGAEQYVDLTVICAGYHMRVQNARSSARDTTEAIRSRISTIKTGIRSS